MSKTIEEIKDEYAINLAGYNTWDELINDEPSYRVEIHTDEISERYAQSQTQELQEHNAELVEMYKECFEMFIPSDKWDEATEFLSTYGSGLAKYLSRKEKHNHLNKKT